MNILNPRIFSIGRLCHLAADGPTTGGQFIARGAFGKHNNIVTHSHKLVIIAWTLRDECV